MKKHFKRALSLAMSVSMLTTLIPTSAFAATPEPGDAAQQSYVADMESEVIAENLTPEENVITDLASDHSPAPADPAKAEEESNSQTESKTALADETVTEDSSSQLLETSDLQSLTVQEDESEESDLQTFSEEEEELFWIDIWQTRGENYHWIYTDENSTELTVPSYVMYDYTVDLTLKAYEGEEFSEDSLIRTYQFGEDFNLDSEGHIELDGAALAASLEDYDLSSVSLKLEVFAIDPTETLVGAGNLDFELREPSVTYHYPDIESTFVRGMEIWFQSNFDHYSENADNPHGAQGDTPIVDVTVETLGDEEEEVCTLEESEYGWRILCNRPGSACITIKYENIGGGHETYSYQIVVAEDVYYLETSFPYDCNVMLPNSQLSFDIRVRHDWNHQNECGCEYVEDFSLAISTDEDGNPLYDQDLIEVTIDSDEKSVFVESDDRTGSTTLFLRATMEDGTEVTQNVELFVETLYTYIDDIEYDPAVLPGSSFTITPCLMKSELLENGESSTSEAEGNIRYVVEYDTGCICITDSNGDEIPSGGSSECEDFTYTIHRQDSYNTEIQVIAYQLDDNDQRWYEVGRTKLRLEDIDFDISFTNMREGDSNFTWVFSDEELTVEASSNVTDYYEAEDLTYTWELCQCQYRDIEEEADVLDYGYTVNEDGSLTLDGEALLDVSREDNHYLFVRYTICYDSLTLVSRTFHLGIMNPIYAEESFWWGDSLLLVDSNQFISNTVQADVFNSEHPDRDLIECRILDCSLEQLPDNEEEPVVCEMDVTEEGWLLHTVACGSAIVTLQYQVEDSEEIKEYQFTLNVTGDILRLNLHYPDDRNNMLPNSTMEIDTSLFYDWFHSYEDRGSMECDTYSLEIVTDEEGEPCYDTDLISVSMDGTASVITSSEQTGYTTVPIRVTYTLDAGTDDEREFESYEELSVHVIEGYTVTHIPALNSKLPIGQLIEVQTSTWEYYVSEEGNAADDITDQVTYEFYYDPSTLSFTNEYGNPIESYTPAEGRTISVFRFEGNSISFEVCVYRNEEDGSRSELDRLYINLDSEDYRLEFEGQDEGEITIHASEEKEITISSELFEYYEPDDITWTCELESGRNESYETSSYVDENGKILLNGTELSALVPGEDRWFFLNVQAYCWDTLIAEGQLSFYVYHDKEIIDSIWGDMSLVPGQAHFMRRGFDAFVVNEQYPFGEHVSCEITAVTIISADEEDEVPCTLVEDESGWTIQTNSLGSVQFLVNYLVEGEERTSTFTIDIVEDTLIVNILYPNGIEEMLTRDEAEILLLVRHNWYYGPDNQGCELVTDYTLSVTDSEGEPAYNTNLVDVILGEETGNLTVISKGELGWPNIPVHVAYTVQREDQEAYDIDTQANVSLNIKDYSFVLDDLGLDAMMGVGESLEFTPELWIRYVEAIEDPEEEGYGICVERVDTQPTHFQISYDTSCLEIRDVNGDRVGNDDLVSAELAPFTLTRLQRYASTFTIYGWYFDSSDSNSQMMSYRRYELEEVTAEEVAVEYYRMSVGDDLSLKYFMSVPDSVINDPAAGMRFHLDGSIVEVGEYTTIDGYYVYSCPIPAAQLATEILAEYYYEGAWRMVSIYSAKEYLITVIDNEEGNPEYARAQDLAISILNYGGYAQQKFAYHTDQLANSPEISAVIENLTDEEVKNAITETMTGVTNNEDLTWYGASLICENDTRLRLYFVNENNLSLEALTGKYQIDLTGLGDNSVSVGEKGNLFYVTVNCIKPFELNSKFNLVISDGTEEINMNYSAFVYIGKAMDSSNTELKKLCKSLYLYYLDALAYQTNTEDNKGDYTEGNA